MTNLNPKIKIYLLSWHLPRVGWNKLAKHVRIYVFKNQVKKFFFSWINAQKHADHI